MNPAEENPWQTHQSEVKYENPWIRVTHNEVTNPSGNEGIYGVVHFKNTAVGVIPVDDEGCTYLVGQYRYTLGTYEWEIPAGGCPQNEEPGETAMRELLEETGLEAASLKMLISNMALSNSISDERAFVYLATGLTQGIARPEETEQLRVKRVPVTEAVDMVLHGKITDSMSVAGLLRLAMMKR